MNFLYIIFIGELIITGERVTNFKQAKLLELKKIIFSLVNDYGVRPKDIMSFIPISAYSVRPWSYVKKSKPGFNQVQLSKPGSVASSRPKKRTLNHIGIQLIFLSAQVLLLAWQLSRH